MRVPMTTLNEYFSERGWPTVDLIKMDIEGRELPAIARPPHIRSRLQAVRLAAVFTCRVGGPSP
jgi:FkbM family methyltransferase